MKKLFGSFLSLIFGALLVASTLFTGCGGSLSGSGACCQTTPVKKELVEKLGIDSECQPVWREFTALHSGDLVGISTSLGKAIAFGFHEGDEDPIMEKDFSRVRLQAGVTYRLMIASGESAQIGNTNTLDPQVLEYPLCGEKGELTVFTTSDSSTGPDFVDDGDTGDTSDTLTDPHSGNTSDTVTDPNHSGNTENPNQDNNSDFDGLNPGFTISTNTF